MRAERLHDLAMSPDPATVVYHDVSADVSGAQRTVEARRRAVVDALRDAGAPDADVDAVDQELERASELGSPSARYLVVRDGAVELSEVFPGELLAPELAVHGVPDLVPVLRHLAAEQRYLVVTAGRDGGEVQLLRAPGRPGERIAGVDGRNDTLTKVRGGGWSHRSMQAHTEKVWRRNADELAQEVDRAVRERRPEFVILAGDVRAVQLLQDQLAPASRGLVDVVETHTRAAGASDEAVTAAVQEHLDRADGNARADAVGRIESGGGARGAHGVGEVVAALQSADVDTLLIAPELLDGRTLLALGTAPWVATDDSTTAGADIVGELPAASALARAALATGAGVVFDRAEEPLHESGAAAALRGGLGPPRPTAENA